MRYWQFIVTIVIPLTSFATEAPDRERAVLDRPRGGDDSSVQRLWEGLNLQIATGELLSQRAGAGRHVLVCRGGFSLTDGTHRYAGDSAVVWIDRVDPNSTNATGPRYLVQAYLKGHISHEVLGPAEGLDLQESVIEAGQAVVVKTAVGGEIYVTAEERQTTSPRGLLLYRESLAAFEAVGLRRFSESESSAPGEPAPHESLPQIELGHTINAASLTGAPVTIELREVNDVQVVTILGRQYAWWQQEGTVPGESTLVELEADGLVLWRRPVDANELPSDVSPMRHERVSEVYVQGDVVVREGLHTIRASEFYYDLRRRRGLARNVVFRTFDPSRNVPIYIRAAELRQTAANHFEAQDVVLTTSEFAKPQVSLRAGSIRVTDKAEPTGQDPQASSDGSFDALMKDVRFKYYDATVFAWPSLHTDGATPDAPIRSIHVGQDSTYGNSLETSWFLSRLLGLREPEGTDSTLMLDYYGKRGPAGGMDIAYERDNYFGRLLGYIIEDHGQDRLSRTQTQVDVPDETRGRLKFQHRHYLPNAWQVTAEAGYESDENFLQQYYRGEFNDGKEQETLLHLKRITDNRGLSFLTKTRINDFQDATEELPSADFHWTGQSFLQDRLTFYSDSQISRYRYRYSSQGTSSGLDDYFTFTTTRNEIDMPLALGRTKLVPYVAGTFGYEDGLGFQADLDDSPQDPEKSIWVGEAGLRLAPAPFWRVYPNVKSRLLDLNQIRHVIAPRIGAVAFMANDAAAEQRDVLSLELSQRWQTKRGPQGRQRTVNWLEWDTDFVWVDHSADESTGPDQLLWNKPFIPLVDRSEIGTTPQDRRATTAFGARRNYIENIWTLRLTDTTAILGDLYLDMNSGTVQQLNVGFSRFCWPNLSYYVGSRYLRQIVSGQEKGSNAVTFAATYVLDPRYTAVFSQQYDFDYGAGIRSDITLIRRYHRLNLALTVSSDESLDERRIVLSLWPQGVPELALGLRRYIGLGTVEAY